MKATNGTINRWGLILGVSLMTLASVSRASETTTMSTADDRHIIHLSDKAWINDVGSLLYSDPDGDGYFAGLSLSIDADSSYHHYSVYAIIDIVNELNEAEHLYTTLPFDVYELSVADEYRIDIDLIQNYSPGIYDLQVALVDANDNRLLDQVNANDFRNLRSLPLESEDNETIDIPVVDRPINPSNDDIRVTEYAGSTGIGVLGFLLVTGLFRISAARGRSFGRKTATQRRKS
ncbi:MAG: choice-of-anchor H family protein [Granulosicoccus sp.]